MHYSEPKLPDEQAKEYLGGISLWKCDELSRMVSTKVSEEKLGRRLDLASRKQQDSSMRWDVLIDRKAERHRQEKNTDRNRTETEPKTVTETGNTIDLIHHLKRRWIAKQKLCWVAAGHLRVSATVSSLSSTDPFPQSCFDFSPQTAVSQSMLPSPSSCFLFSVSLPI